MGSHIDHYMDELKADGRACPADWPAFHRLLSSYQRPGTPKPPVPMILAASAESPASKHGRLREQLRWADAHGCLDESLAFLQSLPADGWEVSSEQAWHKDSYPTW